MSIIDNAYAPVCNSLECRLAALSLPFIRMARAQLNSQQCCVILSTGQQTIVLNLLIWKRFMLTSEFVYLNYVYSAALIIVCQHFH